MNQKKWLNGLEDRGAVISVVGLGYVELPTALNFHNAGFVSLVSIPQRRLLNR